MSFICLISLILSLTAQRIFLSEATFSVVAADSVTREIGGAGALCMANRSVFDVLYVGIPNKMVLHTQGLAVNHSSFIVKNAKLLVDEMKESNPEYVLDIMLAGDHENETIMETNYSIADLRQYGIVTIVDDGTDSAKSDGYTGSALASVFEAMGYYGTTQEDVAGTAGDSVTYHIQGSVMTDLVMPSMTLGITGDTQKLDDMAETCDLPGRLMAAMVSVVHQNNNEDAIQGDARCVGPLNTSSTGAFLHVDSPDGSVLVHIDIVGNGEKDAIKLLHKEFNKWRKDHPCSGKESGSARSGGVADLSSNSTNLTIPDFSNVTFSPPYVPRNMTILPAEGSTSPTSAPTSSTASCKARTYLSLSLILTSSLLPWILP